MSVFQSPSRVSAVDRAPAVEPRPADAPRPPPATFFGALFGDYRRRSAAVGQALTWLCGGALALNLLLVISILLLLAWNGLSYFWQKDLIELTLKDGHKVLGEVWSQEQSAAETGARAAAAIDPLRLKIGNRDGRGLVFVWIDAKDVPGRTRPRDVVMLERLEWGNF